MDNRNSMLFIILIILQYQIIDCEENNYDERQSRNDPYGPMYEDNSDFKPSICAWSDWSMHPRCEWLRYSKCASLYTRQCLPHPPHCSCNQTGIVKPRLPMDNCIICPSRSRWSAWGPWFTTNSQSTCTRVRRCVVGGKYSITLAGCIPLNSRIENRSIFDENGNQMQCEPGFLQKYGTWIGIGVAGFISAVIYYFFHKQVNIFQKCRNRSYSRPRPSTSINRFEDSQMVSVRRSISLHSHDSSQDTIMMPVSSPVLPFIGSYPQTPDIQMEPSAPCEDMDSPPPSYDAVVFDSKYDPSHHT